MNYPKRFLLLVLLASTFVTFGQHKPFQFGFSGGVNVGWFVTDNDEYSNDGAKIGGSWGFVADIFLMEHYSFTTGFNVQHLNGSLTHQGSYIYPETGEGVDGTLYSDIKLRYLQIPFIFTMKTKNIKEKLRIYGQVGYGLGFRLNEKSKNEFISDEGETIYSSDETSELFTATRSSLILGIGVEIPLHKSMYIRTGLKFDNCFVDMIKSDFEKLRYNFLELSAAVIF